MFYWIDRMIRGLGKAGIKREIVFLAAALFLLTLPFAVLSAASKTVALEVDGQVIRQTTCCRTVGQLLEENQVVLNCRDVVEPGLEEGLQEGQLVRVLRSFPVRVLADGREVELYTCRQTVAQVLEDAGVELGGLDRVEPAREAEVCPNDQIRVYRREEKIVELKRSIPAPLERTADYTLERGIQRTVQRGAAGVMVEKVKVLLEDGREIMRQTLSEEVVKQPVARIVAEGALTSISRGGQRIDFERVIVARATAYSYSAGSLTSTGQRVRVGGVAVDPTVIPYGTRLYIEGYGYATAIDCGGAIKGNRIDVFLESDKECRKWGVKTVKVYILR